MTNKLISEVLGTVAAIAPSSQTAGAVATPALVLAQYRKILFTVIAGSLGSAGTVDFKIQASVDGSTSWVDVPGAAIAQIIGAGSPLAQIEVRADRFAALNLGGYLRGVITVAVNACLTAVLAQGGDVRYMLASDLNLTGMPAAVVV